jgi:hypothetical protein
MLRRSSFSPLEQTRAVVSVYVHPKYDPFTLENDITLLKVQEPFQLNQWAAPACLPSLGYFPQNDTLCTVIGWGNVQENGPECKTKFTFEAFIFQTTLFQIPSSGFPS